MKGLLHTKAPGTETNGINRRSKSGIFLPKDYPHRKRISTSLTLLGDLSLGSDPLRFLYSFLSFSADFDGLATSDALMVAAILLPMMLTVVTEKHGNFA